VNRESLNEVSELKRAIRANDLARVDKLLTSSPDLRQFLIDDVPLQGQAQPGRVPMMELLVRHGADVNGLAWGWFPVLFTPCENIEPEPLQWLLDHGADPNRGNPNDPGTALDYVISTYPRDSRRLTACVEMLLAAGGRTRYSDVPGFLPMLRGRTGELAALVDADPSLLKRRFAELDCGLSGGRLLTLRGTALLHVAAEFGFVDAARLLLDRGADVNARADVDATGIGGQTPIFHALTQGSSNRDAADLFVARGADLSIRARVPGHHEHPGEILDVSAAEYGELFPLS
jgi:ankyrin repeat protein